MNVMLAAAAANLAKWMRWVCRWLFSVATIPLKMFFDLLKGWTDESLFSTLIFKGTF